MSHRVCPWWLGYFLASPLRRLLEDPTEILGPYVQPGMTVLEPGPGMGFFTRELARKVGPEGRVVAIDVQPRMLNGLRSRLQKAGLAHRVDARLASAESLGIQDLAGKVDFILAYAVVHEMASSRSFFDQASAAAKPGARLLMVEPKGHVTPQEFESELQDAAEAGFVLSGHPSVPRGTAALLQKL
jgi:cyclopropane fatty-acyl-phospholipid synthase-like methyltransferase